MIRWLVRLVGLVALAALVTLPVWGPHTPDTPDARGEVTRITSYVADFRVADDGRLDVDEKVTVSFPDGFERHGIFRFWDLRDPSAPYSRRIPRDIAVTQDGQHVPVEMSTESDHRYRVARIGDPNNTVHGSHVYEIRYRIDGVLEKGTDGQRTQLYWNLVPGGWQQPIDRAVLRVHLPADATATRCAVGNGATSGCTATGDGTQDLTVRAAQLAPLTPVTLKTGLDLATPPAGDTRPWVSRLDPVLGPSVPAFVVICLLALLAAALGLWVTRTVREPRPGFPLMYAPPDGLGPAQGAYLLTEKVGREAFVATLMQAGEKGAATVSRSGKDWTIEHVAGAPWGDLDDVTRELGTHLNIRGGSFTAKPGDPEAGERLKSAQSEMVVDTRAWAQRAGYMTKSGLGGAGRLAVLVAVGLAVWLVLGNPTGTSLTAAVPGMFAVFGWELVLPGSGTRRTPAGRELWSRLGGFRRILSTPSSEARFDFAARRDLFTAYLPWAVAFGCADAWAAKYRDEMGAEPPVPSYFVGYYGGGQGAFVDSMVHDFDATVSSAVSSYEATQHSSGGGGGFSGGGGGGGGGGGSW